MYSTWLMNHLSWPLLALAVLHYGFWPIAFAIEYIRRLQKLTRPMRKFWWLQEFKDVTVPTNFRDHGLYAIPAALLMTTLFAMLIVGIGLALIDK
ncbi:hypothetical protein [Pseudomonas phage D6]|nr:hypothetical protein [Pseudomonas phage D6]